MKRVPVLAFGVALVSAAAFAAALSPSHLEGYKAEAREPMVPVASIARASHFLETWSLKWTRQNKCGTCHTNLAHVMAEPFLVERDKAAEKEIRDSLFDFLASYKPGEVPPDQQRANNNILWNRLVIASIFAISDGEAGMPQDPRTLARFDQIWAMQNPDGSFNYPRKALPFLEDDKYYVMTLVSIAANYLPADHLRTEAAANGIRKLNHYLATTPPRDQHGELVLMRAATGAPELMSPAARADLIKRTLALQRADGGWAVASLGDWPRIDGGSNDKAGPSDGYGTGFVLYTLCKTGTPPGNPAVQKGMIWLRTHQRESGRWFTKSLWSDDYHNYVSTIGTAYAVMALRQCAPGR
ncbi:MAG: terpene cyclase/mutase family protein [Rhodospirillaceae bacterium]|nr:terpene cyclase/mutase family protein [Rhodospirillaceae bacterium]